VKQTILTSTTSVQARVDETKLRQKQLDVLPKLLEIMRREEEALPPLLDLSPLPEEPR